MIRRICNANPDADRALVPGAGYGLLEPEET